MERNDLKIKTFGCRLNIWESEMIQKFATKAGVKNTLIINSCAVTSNAEKDILKYIKKEKKNHSKRNIILTGCSAQINSDLWKQVDEIDFIVGNTNKLNLKTWKNLKENNLNKINVDDIENYRLINQNKLNKFKQHTRSFLQIQQGCDHRCTFCIIPFARGPNRSLSIENIVNSINQLVANGTKEIILTGVDIASWGIDLFNKPSLGRLVQSILAEVPELPRLRLSSIDPAILDYDLMDAFQNEPRLMPHIHLSMQHGNDIILKRMKRRHLSKDIINFCEEARRKRNNIVFGADIISGFPTETIDAHNDTKKLLDYLDISFLHVFPFSIRNGTPSAKMPQINQRTIKERATDLRNFGKYKKNGYFNRRIGTLDMMLLEKNGKGYLSGFEKAKLKDGCNDDYAFGSLLPVKITDQKNEVLTVEKLK